MKVVVVGASGNVGTALLRALADADDVDSVVAIARRTPGREPGPPYDVATWRSIDVAAPRPERVLADLSAAMDGADAVVQLAWAIQPSHDRALLRRTNVIGTTRVLQCAVEAGVPHVVVASSSGAYSPAHDDARHDESWPTKGHPTCEYSVDKADVEDLLDLHEGAHPDVTLTRLRPALIFQRDAGAEIVRYFLGPLVPARTLAGRMPILPWPKGLRLQVVHADDAAAAYVAALRHAPGGAFNIAAEGVIGRAEAAAATSGGRAVDVPAPMARAAVSAAWNARVAPTSPGWIDMAIGAPLMSTDKAREVLGWEPRIGARDTVHEIVAAMADGAGTVSPPLRPRRRPC